MTAEEEFEKWWKGEHPPFLQGFDEARAVYLAAAEHYTKATAQRCFEICRDAEARYCAAAIKKEFDLE